jgi:hypothetical protein
MFVNLSKVSKTYLSLGQRIKATNWQSLGSSCVERLMIVRQWKKRLLDNDDSQEAPIHAKYRQDTMIKTQPAFLSLFP